MIVTEVVNGRTVIVQFDLIEYKLLAVLLNSMSGLPDSPEESAAHIKFAREFIKEGFPGDRFPVRAMMKMMSILMAPVADQIAGPKKVEEFVERRDRCEAEVMLASGDIKPN